MPRVPLIAFTVFPRLNARSVIGRLKADGRYSRHRRLFEARRLIKEICYVGYTLFAQILTVYFSMGDHLFQKKCGKDNFVLRVQEMKLIIV